MAVELGPVKSLVHTLHVTRVQVPYTFQIDHLNLMGLDTVIYVLGLCHESVVVHVYNIQ